MKRTKKKSDFVSYDYEQVAIAIRESRNLSRWNPFLAVQTMQKVSLKLTSKLQEDSYNKAVDNINYNINSIMKKRYYNDENYWRGNNPCLLEKENVFE